MTKNFYVTSPIYYVNDVPHIGHAYTSLACDVTARFKRLQGFDVRFLTGTDEHGQKVEKSALSKEKTPIEFCNEVSKKFRELNEIMQFSNDDFIRTTEDRHKKCATEIWHRLEQNGYIYKGIYEGWYAVRDEAFYSEDEITNGKAPSGAEVEWQKQESYFFRLSAFEDKLLALYEAVPDFVQPKSKMSEVLSFVKGGLKDLSISRNTFSWGVEVPKTEPEKENKHIMYVWLDALTNYLSALGFPDENNDLFQKFWLNTEKSPIHIVGKDILRFHAIYWPAFLMAANLPLPHSIFAHGWWTNEGEKISKSVGNVIDPVQEINWLESLGCSEEQAIDYFKYFLMREIPFGNDGDYSRSRLVQRINSELANNIGNLTQRSLSMIHKNNDDKIVDISNYNEGMSILREAFEMVKNFEEKMEKMAYDKAIFEIINFASTCNQFINDKAPWKLKKEEKIDEMNQILSTIANCLVIISSALEIFLPNLTKKMQLFLQKNEKFSTIKQIYEENFKNIKPVLEKDHKIKKPQAIFSRIEEQNITK